MHDLVDPYQPQRSAEELELSLRRLQVQKDRERYLESVAAAEEVMRQSEAKSPVLAAKQARLLGKLKSVIC